MTDAYSENQRWAETYEPRVLPHNPREYGVNDVLTLKAIIAHLMAHLATSEMRFDLRLIQAAADDGCMVTRDKLTGESVIRSGLGS